MSCVSNLLINKISVLLTYDDNITSSPHVCHGSMCVLSPSASPSPAFLCAVVSVAPNALRERCGVLRDDGLKVNRYLWHVNMYTNYTMYIYIYIYMYIYIYVCVCVCVYVDVYSIQYVYNYTKNVNVNMYIYIYIVHFICDVSIVYVHTHTQVLRTNYN